MLATDLDTGLNGETEYSILSGNEKAAFLIDSARGILATTTVLDHEDTSSYRFVCKVLIKMYSFVHIGIPRVVYLVVFC